MHGWAYSHRQRLAQVLGGLLSADGLSFTGLAQRLRMGKDARRLLALLGDVGDARWRDRGTDLELAAAAFSQFGLILWPVEPSVLADVDVDVPASPAQERLVQQALGRLMVLLEGRLAQPPAEVVLERAVALARADTEFAARLRAALASPDA